MYVRVQGQRRWIRAVANRCSGHGSPLFPLILPFFLAVLLTAVDHRHSSQTQINREPTVLRPSRSCARSVGCSSKCISLSGVAGLH